MKPIDHVSLTFKDNGRFHEDLILRIGDEDHRCDSYYLLLDGGAPDMAEGPCAKVARVLALLLKQWKHAVAELSEGAHAFLPYDFSDQCTAWLRCIRQGGMLRIQRGWSGVEGWSLSPSALGDRSERVRDFRPDGGECVISIEDFLSCIAGGPAPG